MRQYHCDWHIGEEAARCEEFPNSIRCGDWTHFTGAALRPKKQSPLSADGAIAAEQRAWRVGIFATMERHSKAVGIAEFVKKWVIIFAHRPNSSAVHNPHDVFAPGVGLQRRARVCQGPPGTLLAQNGCLHRSLYVCIAISLVGHRSIKMQVWFSPPSFSSSLSSFCLPSMLCNIDVFHQEEVRPCGCSGGGRSLGGSTGCWVQR